jgi:tRNA C32,U32 (ribose-2'-O)-methylase TrmJ
LNGTRQLLVYADDVNENINIMKNLDESLPDEKLSSSSSTSGKSNTAKARKRTVAKRQLLASKSGEVGRKIAV